MMKGIILIFVMSILTACSSLSNNTSHIQNQPVDRKPSMEPVTSSPKQQSKDVTAPPMMGPGY